MSPSKQLMTVGRLATPPDARLIVLVMRSGIDANRFSPNALSFMKPEMIGRLRKSAVHSASTSANPLHPRVLISCLSSAHIAGVKTSPTGTSRVPGLEMNSCTSIISLL